MSFGLVSSGNWPNVDEAIRSLLSIGVHTEELAMAEVRATDCSHFDCLILIMDTDNAPQVEMLLDDFLELDSETALVIYSVAPDWEHGAVQTHQLLEQTSEQIVNGALNSVRLKKTQRQRAERLSYDVFLSYRRNDGFIVNDWIEPLHRANISFWFDQSKLSEGASWSSEILLGICSSRLFVLILSEDMTAQSYSWKEYRYAVEKECPILVIPYADKLQLFYDFTGTDRNEYEAVSAVFPVEPTDADNEEFSGASRDVNTVARFLRNVSLPKTIIIEQYDYADGLPAIVEMLGIWSRLSWIPVADEEPIQAELLNTRITPRRDLEGQLAELLQKWDALEVIAQPTTQDRLEVCDTLWAAWRAAKSLKDARANGIAEALAQACSGLESIQPEDEEQVIEISRAYQITFRLPGDIEEKMNGFMRLFENHKSCVAGNRNALLELCKTYHYDLGKLEIHHFCLNPAGIRHSFARARFFSDIFSKVPKLGIKEEDDYRVTKDLWTSAASYHMHHLARHAHEFDFLESNRSDLDFLAALREVMEGRAYSRRDQEIAESVRLFLERVGYGKDGQVDEISPPTAGARSAVGRYYHPAPAELIRNLGENHDHEDLYKYPCCNHTVLTVNNRPPGKFDGGCTPFNGTPV